MKTPWWRKKYPHVGANFYCNSILMFCLNICLIAPYFQSVQFLHSGPKMFHDTWWLETQILHPCNWQVQGICRKMADNQVSLLLDVWNKVFPKLVCLFFVNITHTLWYKACGITDISTLHVIKNLACIFATVMFPRKFVMFAFMSRCAVWTSLSYLPSFFQACYLVFVSLGDLSHDN